MEFESLEVVQYKLFFQKIAMKPQPHTNPTPRMKFQYTFTNTTDSVLVYARFQNPESYIIFQKEQMSCPQEIIQEAIKRSNPYLDLIEYGCELNNHYFRYIEKLERKLRSQEAVNAHLQILLGREQNKYTSMEGRVLRMRQILLQVRRENNQIMETLDRFQETRALRRRQRELQINLDFMTYEQILQLQQRIGVVPKRVNVEKIQSLPKIQVEEKNTQICVVCQSEYEEGEMMTRIPNCKHEFHLECLVSWLRREKICPICKQEIIFQEEKENNNE